MGSYTIEPGKAYIASNRDGFAARGDDWINRQRDQPKTPPVPEREAVRAVNAAIAAAQKAQARPHAFRRKLTLREYQLDNRDRILARSVNVPPKVYDCDLAKAAMRPSPSIDPVDLSVLHAAAAARDAARRIGEAARAARQDAWASEFGFVID